MSANASIATRDDASSLLTPDDVCEYLSINMSTVRRARNERRFAPAIKIGRHLRWAKADLDAWLDDQREDVVWDD